MSVSPVPSRRSVVRGAAWSLPAVAVAAHAPAHATSSADFAFLPGSTGVRSRNWGGSADFWYDLYFGGASVRAGATAIPAGGLTLSLTWTVSDPAHATELAYVEMVPSPWAATLGPGSGVAQGEPWVLTFPFAVPVGGIVTLPDGFWFGADKAGIFGTYVLQASAPGETPSRHEYTWEGEPLAPVAAVAAAVVGGASSKLGLRS